MSIATLTSKGQVTIPADVREALRLHAGDRIDFVVDSSGGARIEPVKKKVSDVFGMLRRKGQRTYSVEEMHDAIGAYVREKFR